MRSWMIAVCVGIMGAGWLPALPGYGMLALLGLLIGGAVGGLVLVGRRLGSGGWRYVLVVLQLILCIALGFGWGVVSGRYALDGWLPKELEGVDFWVHGMIDSLPRYGGRAQQFEFKVTADCFDLHPDACIEGPRRTQLRRVLLNYYGDHQLVPGQQWRLRVRLNRPHGFANPGGFDYELMLLQKGINAKGYVRETEFNIMLADNALSYQKLRFQLRQRLLQATAELPHHGIILALVLGERDLIAPSSWQLFTRTGTNHLVVISGLHVGFVAMFGYWLTNLFMRLIPALLLHLPAQKAGAVGAIAAALAYSVLAGFSLPTQRALIMVAVFMSGRLLARNFPASLGYCVAMTLVLILTPLGAMSAGFWLSFVAVGALLLAFSSWTKAAERIDSRDKTDHIGSKIGNYLHSVLRWSAWGRPQWVVFVGMSVPLAIWLQQLSLLSPLANIFAIPLVSLLVVPLCLFGLLSLLLYERAGVCLLVLADQLLTTLTLTMSWMAESFAWLQVWQFSGLTVWSYLFAGLGSVLWLLPRGWPGRILAPLLMLPLFMPARLPSPGYGEVWISFLDVGQGLAVVAQSAAHTLVYDTGPRFSDSFDAGNGVVVPFLHSRGIRTIDRLMVSHGDNDHAGGLESLLLALDVKQLLLGTDMRTSGFGLPTSHCLRGQSWQWDGVNFEILHPDESSYRSPNDNSCVLRISTASSSVLLTGDVEALAEAALLRVHADQLRSDVLLAPHHGSKSSSTDAFVTAVNPQFVVYSSGYRNQFDHPADVVQARYQALNAFAFNTAEMGMIEFRSGAEPSRIAIESGTLSETQPSTYRLTRQRYWSGEQRQLFALTSAGTIW